MKIRFGRAAWRTRPCLDRERGAIIAPKSDTDIRIEFEPSAPVTVFDYANLKGYIAELFEGPVDVVTRDGLKRYVRDAATADAIYAF